MVDASNAASPEKRIAVSSVDHHEFQKRFSEMPKPFFSWYAVFWLIGVTGCVCECSCARHTTRRRPKQDLTVHEEPRVRTDAATAARGNGCSRDQS